MATYDGSINIDTRVSNRGFNTGIRSMIGSLKGLAAAVGVAFGVGAMVQFGKTAVSAAGELQAAMVGLESVLSGMGRSFSEAQDFITEFISDGLVPATNAIMAYRNLALRGYDTSQIQTTLTILKDASAFARQGSLTMGQAIQSASEGLKNENSILVDNAGITKNVSVMWREYAAEIGTTVNNLTLQQKIQAEVNGLMRESQFQTGDAARLAGGYAGQVAALGTSFYNLRVAIGNAVIPILSRLIPYIKAVVDWFVVLFNTIARFIGLLFGVNASMASIASSSAGIADTTNAAAGSSGALAKNTKQAERAAKGALAAFDDINVLQMETADGGGGGAGMAMPGMPAMPALTGDIKDIIPDELLSKVEAFRQRLQDLWEKIDWEKIRTSLDNLRDSLTPFANIIGEGLLWFWDNVLVPLGTFIANEVLPVFLDGLAATLDVLTAVLEALKPLGLWLWESFLQPIANWVGQALIDSLTWLVERLRDLSDWINENQAVVELFTIVIGSFAVAWLLVTAAMAVWTAVSSFAAIATTALGAAVAFLTSPVFLVILAIGLLIAIIVLLVRNWDRVKEIAAAVWEWIVAQWGIAASWFRSRVLLPMENWFRLTWDNIRGFFVNTWLAVQAVWTGVSDWIREKVTLPIHEAFGSALDWVQDKWRSVFTNVRDFVKDRINNIIDFINGMIRAIGAGINALIDALNKFSIVDPFTGRRFGFNIQRITMPQIPRLATGAVIPPNSEFLAVLGDQRSGRNIEAPEELIRQIVREESGNQRSQEITIRFAGDLAGLVRELKPYIDKENRRIGGSLIVGST